MNDYLTNVGPSLDRKFDKPWIYSGLDYVFQLQNIETSADELLRYIHAINTTKSSAINNI